jgi:hypothetical protein
MNTKNLRWQDMQKKGLIERMKSALRRQAKPTIIDWVLLASCLVTMVFVIAKF